MTRFIPGSLTLLAVLAFAPDAEAKAYYAPLSEVEERVDAVAIVDTASVAAVDIEGEHWVYHELALAHVVDVVAGTLPRTIDILGGRDFICAPVSWDAGRRYLALLEREGDRWTATNNEWGRLEIVDGKVAWPYDESNEPIAVEEIVLLLELRLEGKLGRGRFTDESIEPVAEIEPMVVVAIPPEPQPIDEPTPAWWILLGAGAVTFGFVVGTRRRRA